MTWQALTSRNRCKPKANTVQLDSNSKMLHIFVEMEDRTCEMLHGEQLPAYRYGANVVQRGENHQVTASHREKKTEFV